MVYGTPEVVRMQRISGFASRYFLMGRSRLRPILVGGDLTLRAEGETDGISGRNFAELLVHPADLGGNRGVLVNQDGTCLGSRAAPAEGAVQAISRQTRNVGALTPQLVARVVRIFVGFHAIA